MADDVPPANKDNTGGEIREDPSCTLASTLARPWIVRLQPSSPGRWDDVGRSCELWRKV